ncbi:beta-lactamase family protein [Rhizobium sp. TRM95111]|uniref:serine hydrolase domain-containing protein n=1 Tax=Rhizobium alarense TaxID=2846851 RepID=UPI001F27FDCD|nr:serine hydrolase [Rhizobium alarense]MCF3639363.1 beta-lactamase family protein [Rhizobium alarense]
MTRFGRYVMRLLAVLAALVGIGAAWLIVRPPELLSVGADYAAKIVCSNVFLAGRDPAEVLALDVQAPGHPLLRLMRQHVDREERTVTAHLLGLFAPGYAAYRPGFGCTSVPDGDFVAARQAVSDVAVPVAPAADEGKPWPAGHAVSTDPRLAAVLSDATLTGPGMRAVVVVHEGRIVGEAYGGGFSVATPLLGWSMTKSVNAVLVGRLFAMERLAPQTAELFPEWLQDGRARITVADLLAMRSGLAFNENYGGVADVTRMLYLEPDMSRFAIARPLEAGPGTRFRYSSGTAVILSRVWMSALKDRWEALTFPARALFVPLGMASAVLETDETGIFVGSSYMYATGRDWARFAQLLLNDGVWNGTRLLPEGFVAAMGTPTPVSNGAYSALQTWTDGPGGEADVAAGLPEDAFWMLGHDGQSTVVIPSLRLAVVRLGLTPSRLDYRPQPMVRRIVDALKSGN